MVFPKKKKILKNVKIINLLNFLVRGWAATQEIRLLNLISEKSHELGSKREKNMSFGNVNQDWHFLTCFTSSKFKLGQNLD